MSSLNLFPAGSLHSFLRTFWRKPSLLINRDVIVTIPVIQLLYYFTILQPPLQSGEVPTLTRLAICLMIAIHSLCMSDDKILCTGTLSFCIENKRMVITNDVLAHNRPKYLE